MQVLVSLAMIVLTAGRVLTISGSSIDQYALPAVEFVPGPIAVDREHDVWFAENAGTRIGELRVDGALRIYPIPGSHEQIQAIVVADDGRVWFTQTQTYDGSHNRVGYILPDGRTTLYRLPRDDAFASAIAADPKGGVWVSEFGAHRVAHVSASGAIREFVLPGPAHRLVRSIDVAVDGTVWVLQDDALVRLSRSGGERRFEIPLPKYIDGMRNMVPAGSGAWWMTAYTKSGRDPYVWRFTIPDRLARYKLPGAGWGPAVIAAGARGSAWMAYDGRIANIDRSGNVVQYMTPFASFDVWGMAADDLGDLWFTNSQTEKLGICGPNIGKEPHPQVAPLTERASEVLRAWKSTLQPRAGYKMSRVTADTISIDRDFAVVGWSDDNGNAATLMRHRDDRWMPVFVTNGNFRRLRDLTVRGVPAARAAQLLRDSAVILVPPA